MLEDQICDMQIDEIANASECGLAGSVKELTEADIRAILQSGWQ
jgi:hypothetical protein